MLRLCAKYGQASERECALDQTGDGYDLAVYKGVGWLDEGELEWCLNVRWWNEGWLVLSLHVSPCGLNGLLFLFAIAMGGAVRHTIGMVLGRVPISGH